MSAASKNITTPLIRRGGQSSIVIALALVVASCATLPDEPATRARFLEGGPSRAEKERKLLPSRPDLGLALSGGGLRSALYSLGVLRALHEKKILEKVEVLSTVSGGSYIGYWLNTGQGGVDSSRPFGFPRLNDAAFSRALCEMKANGNFVPFPLMARSVLTGGPAGTVRMYVRRIEDVYGDLDTSRMKFRDTADLRRKGYPYLIVGATVQRPKPSGWHEAVYEFTAAGTRWGPRGEQEWTSDSDITYAKAVAISGAAFGPALKQTIPEPPPTGAITLYDGGKSENLGALPLIRRAVKTIIIVDAEHDPKYTFGAYVNLRTRLQAWNAGIEIREIDDFLEPKKGDVRRKPRESPTQSYFQGKAWGLRSDGTTFKCDIHYFKMSMPQPLKDHLENSRTPPPAFTEFNSKMEEALDRRNGRYDCAKLAYELPLIPFFEHAVADYGIWWNSTRRARLPLNSAALNFPQYTTFDQSMYGDQVPAFIGLGYLQGQQYPKASPPKAKQR